MYSHRREYSIFKEFGISIAGEEQNVVCSVAGRHSGRHIDKIGLLKEADIANFYESKSINVPMIQDAAMNAECRLMKQEELGDHIMFVGEIVEISANENIKPLRYHNGKYWRLRENVLLLSRRALRIQGCEPKPVQI